MKYKSYIYKWLINKKDYIKESTYANYSNIIFNYIIPKLGNYNTKKINYNVVQEFITFLYNHKKLSVKTIKDVISVVKMSLKDFSYNFINYKFSYPKEKEIKKVNILSKEEQNKIVKYIFDNINYKNMGILLSLTLGIRIGELCALKWDDIDLDNETININKTIQRIYTKDFKKIKTKILISNPKSLNSNRIIPLNADLINLFCKLKNHNNYYFLTGNENYIEPRNYRNYFNKVLEDLNIKHYKFHTLRHTFATNCIELGFDYKVVSEILGHSNINTTLNIYVHPKLSLKKECIKSIYDNIK